ncbi:MAG TPA: Gfo/Idh/MocA family oxidoreductase [Steroidobacteraceae bacterium]|jgi:D-galactose 1-dehydrogenase|nr:Gfo/Idh/MocA family oxidoreductase [Steroidobacteraceae bacterium]
MSYEPVRPLAQSGRPIRVALVGIGKIARAQHLPALRADSGYALTAAVSRHSAVEGTQTFSSLDALLRSDVRVDAVSLSTPPVGRHALACAAIDAGLHVMLEKPPGATVAEVLELEQRARRAGVSLFASWHSREASGVAPAREWLATRRIRQVRATWKEDIRVWHPGQDWILNAGGLGVFDPGINCFSILTRILPGSMHLQRSTLHVPVNREGPIAATLDFLYERSTPVHAEFDFLYGGEPAWTIEIETDGGSVTLAQGGHRLHIESQEIRLDSKGEYPKLYARFAQLIAARESDVDVMPLQHVADAFLLAQRRDAPAFEF